MIKEIALCTHSSAIIAVDESPSELPTDAFGRFRVDDCGRILYRNRAGTHYRRLTHAAGDFNKLHRAFDTYVRRLRASGVLELASA